ncbi:MAG: hypothetical protein AAGJ31_01485 [Verrucomicrobiota bacterium]
MNIPRNLSVLLTLLSAVAFADDKPGEHNHDHDHGAGHHPTILIPGELSDVWAHLNAYQMAVTDAAAAGDMETLHKEQTNLEALVAELSHTTGEFKVIKRKRVEGMIKNAIRAMGQLHVATDAGDVSGAQKAIKGLTGVLALLKAQYPKDVTGGMAEVKDDIGPHEGMLAAILDGSGKPSGHLELKLHDDKGDLELWLARDGAIATPFDLPAASKITVSFDGAKEESVTLAVRNTDQNEDEDGHATMRDGKTNYFIFPGSSGADASWLVEADFKATVTITFTAPSGSYHTEPFLLIPHGHPGHEH